MATDINTLGRGQKCSNTIIFLSALAPLSLYGHFRQNRTRNQLQLIPILRQDAFIHCLNFKESQKGVVISDIIIFILSEGCLMSEFFLLCIVTNPISCHRSSKERLTLQCLYKNLFYKEL